MRLPLTRILILKGLCPPAQGCACRAVATRRREERLPRRSSAKAGATLGKVRMGHASLSSFPYVKVCFLAGGTRCPTLDFTKGNEGNEEERKWYD